MLKISKSISIKIRKGTDKHKQIRSFFELDISSKYFFFITTDWNDQQKNLFAAFLPHAICESKKKFCGKQIL